MAGDHLTTKICSRCGEATARSEFHRSSGTRDGLHAFCKPCVKMHNAAYQKANAEAIRIRRAAYYAANCEQIRTKSSIYNRAHREARAARMRAWYQRNAEKQRRYAAAWRKANPAEQKARDAAYRNANKEAHAARHAAWRRANPQAVAVLRHKRRARKLAAVGEFSTADIAEIRTMQRDRCAACRVSLRRKGEVDHIIALSAAGKNDRRNLQLLCKSCNSAKRDKDQIDFMRSRGRLL